MDKNNIKNAIETIISFSKDKAQALLIITALCGLLSCGDGDNYNDKRLPTISKLNKSSTYSHSLTKKQLDTLGFLTTGDVISVQSDNPDELVNATVMELALEIFGKDSINLWSKNARIRFVKANLLSLEEADLQTSDMPSDSVEDVILYHNSDDLEPKEIEFNEDMDLYKNIIIVLGSDYEGHQRNQSLKKYGDGIKKINTQNDLDTYKANNSHIFVIKTEKGLEEFSLKNKKAGLIILKGHFGMVDELKKINDIIKKGSTVVFAGGCGSFNSTSDYLSMGLIPITNKSTGKGAINDPLSIKLIKELQKKGLKKTIEDYEKKNPVNVKNNIVFPNNIMAQKVNGSI